MALTTSKPPTAQRGPQDGGADDSGDEAWLQRARSAFNDSTTYIDNNLRKGWDDSIRAFNNQHSSDSKYNNPAFEKRSKLFRPKTRAIIRKNEAAAAAAFFSNMDVVAVTAVDQSNKLEVASAEVMKELLQQRLTKTIPWFQVVLGGLQDAQATGVACAHVYWEYEPTPQPDQTTPTPPENAAEDEYPQQLTIPLGGAAVEAAQPTPLQTMPVEEVATPAMQSIQNPIGRVEDQPKPRVDKPVIDLFPVENLRIDPGANWMDPINSSPYIIHLIPMYVLDIKAKIASGEWRDVAEGVLRNAALPGGDSTRGARDNREDRYSADNSSVPDYETVWVQRHIHRRDGEDWEFYTVADIALLTDPKPLKESVFHGKRPYVMGCCILETHKLYPSSVGQLGKGLQEEANEIANQRIDNVKFVLNKKWFAKRGAEVDVGGLVRNVPGGVVMMGDPTTDVKEVTWPDVTASAFEEQGRIDNDMNDLLGNFSAAQVMADHGINGPARNMALLGQSSGTLVEYLLRTYVETFVQPVLRQLVLLEQEYETDETVLAIAAKRAQLLQKYGMDRVTDDLLSQELTLTVAVGMNATDPNMKLQKFVAGVTTFAQLAKLGVPGLNLQETGKEIFGHLGYSDGSRFFINDNPQIIQMQQQMQQMAQTIQQLNAKVQEKQTAHQVKLEAAKISAKASLDRQMMHEDNENLRSTVTHLRAINEQSRDHQHQIRSMLASNAHTQVTEQQRSMAQGMQQTPQPEQQGVQQ